jgi:hypothetical protein
MILPPLAQDDKKSQAFMARWCCTMDAPHYRRVAFRTQVPQVQARLPQVARAPGKTIVSSRCAFLILGVFGMLYVRTPALGVAGSSPAR